MKKTRKQNLQNTLWALLFIAIFGGILFAAVKYAPKDKFADNGLLQDVADKYRY